MRDRILFEHELAVVSILHNESRYVGEWLEYHYRLGVDKFYIYDIESEDRAELVQILKPWIQAGIVDYNDQKGMGEFLQILSDVSFWQRCDCRYLCMLSVYEFIYLKENRSLLEFIDEHFSRNIATASLAITRIHFGSSGEEFYRDESVVERFTKRSKSDVWMNNRVTSIMNPRRIRSVDHDAFGKYYGGALAFDENQNWIKWETTPIKSTEKIQVNSYYTRSKSEFEELARNPHPNPYRYRSPDVIKVLDTDAFEDTSFRDFYRKFMRLPMPNIRERGDQVIVNNLLKMLEPTMNPHASDKIFEGNAEMFMTCFLLALRNRRIDERKMRALELLALESLYHAMTLPDFRMWEILWIIDSYPEFMQSDSEPANKIIRGIKGLMHELILDVASAGRDWEDYIDLLYRQKLFDLI